MKKVKRIEEANINLPNAIRHLVKTVLIICLIAVMNKDRSNAVSRGVFALDNIKMYLNIPYKWIEVFTSKTGYYFFGENGYLHREMDSHVAYFLILWKTFSACFSVTNFSWLCISNFMSPR